VVVKSTLGTVVMAGLVLVASCGESKRTNQTAEVAGRGGASNRGGGDSGGRAGAVSGGTTGHAGTAGHRATAGAGGTSGGSGGFAAGGVADGGAGDSGGSAGSVEPSHCVTAPSEVSGHSFDVNLTGATFDGLGDWPIPSMLRLEGGATGLELVFGTEGQAVRGSVKSDGSKLLLDGELLARDWSGNRPWSQGNGVYIEKLELCFHASEDGGSATLEGKGEMLVIENSDDTEDQWDDSIEFVAHEDSTPPTLPDEYKIHPLEGELVPASEPLATGASAELMDAAGTPLEAVESADTVIGFRASEVLPLGVDATVAADAHDLAGLALDSKLRLRTAADPGVQALDGFESELHAADYGYPAASLVTDSRVLEGSASLLVQAGDDVVLHLVRPSASATKIRFDLAEAPFRVDFPANIVVRAAVVGGKKIASVEVPVAPFYPLCCGEGGGPGTGDPGTVRDPVPVELELTEPGDDILLSIVPPDIEESANAVCDAIVDRLRIE
jgi:hypothetical protein